MDSLNVGIADQKMELCFFCNFVEVAVAFVDLVSEELQETAGLETKVHLNESAQMRDSTKDTCFVKGMKT